MRRISCRRTISLMLRSRTATSTDDVTRIYAEGGEIRVRVQQRDGQTTLAVADTGQGISAEDLPHIFERFWRADQARTHGGGRSGLGLAIAKTIVDAHGGSLGVASEPGVGSTFTLRLRCPM